MKTTTRPSAHLMNYSPLRVCLLIAFVLACVALLPIARAVTPAPDGGYVGWNTAEGQDALFSNATGSFNTAIGGDALYADTTGSANTAVGAFSLAANSSGFQNAAVGQGALRYNTTGFGNTANGFQALFFNTSGAGNAASGTKALLKNTIGFDNTATGGGALYSNSTGSNNTATGGSALYSNTLGGANTATGLNALFSNTTGLTNTADGAIALANMTAGSGNIGLGYFAGGNHHTGDNNIDIGNFGVDTESNTIRIGGDVGFGPHTATFIAGIANAMVTGSAVYIDTNTGQLGLLSSSERFKDQIQPMGNASEAVLSLRPVTFRYQKNIDPARRVQFGLVAEQVEKVNPDLVVRDAKGKIFTVRYEAVNAMLLNEFLKEHGTVQDLKAVVARQQKQIEALTAGLQKVSAQLEASRRAKQTVVSNP